MSLKSMAVTHLRVCTSILILSAVSILKFPDVRNMFSQLRLIIGLHLLLILEPRAAS